MNRIPPTSMAQLSRRRASGQHPHRLSWIVLAIALVAGSCGATPSSLPVAGTAPPSEQPNQTLEGLLVLSGGGIQVTDADGVLAAVDQPAAQVIAVSAGDGVILLTDDDGRTWFSRDPGDGARSWKELDLPAVAEPEARFVAVSPSGTAAAIAVGELQGRTFDLSLLDLATSARRALLIDRGLDGPPTWLGSGQVAIHILAPDQASTMGIVDVAAMAFDDGRPSGYLVTASADGQTVAVDDPATGEILVGSRRDWLAGALQAMTRIPNAQGPTIERLALDAAGTRLGVVRSSEASSTVEMLVLGNGRWASAGTVTIRGEGPVGIAWLH